MCLDLDPIQMSTIGFLAEMILESSKLLTMYVNGGFENREQLVCTNHDFMHKSEVDHPSCIGSKPDVGFVGLHFPPHFDFGEKIQLTA